MRNSTFKMSQIMFCSFIILFLLINCVPFRPALYEKTSYNIDLSKYENEGLFITTGDYYQNYEPLSILTVTCYDGYIYKGTAKPTQLENENYYDDLYSNQESTYKMKDFDYKSCYVNDLLDFLFESAKKLNAKGIIRLEIKSVTQISPINGQTQDGLLITGLAIKEK